MASSVVESLEFRVSGMAEDAFEVFRVDGEEAISSIFRFDVDMVCDDPDLDLAAVQGRRAELTLAHHDERRTFYGIIGAFEQRRATDRGTYVYRARLVPRLSLLDLSQQNQIYGTSETATVVDVIRKELTADGLRGPGAELAGRLTGQDFELRIAKTYPERDYIVQYNETDLAFISRLAEHYGIFYFFEHRGGRDVVVFADSKMMFVPSGDDTDLIYREVSGLVADNTHYVSEFLHRATPLPNKVVLRDYNYRLPHISMQAEAIVDPNGHGVVVQHGDHFANPQEGETLARIRAEEIRCRASTFSGRSNCFKVSPGHQLTLSDHFRSSYNDRYVVTRVTHRATYPVLGIADATGGTLESSYTNTFDCIPFDTEFRPQRVTPVPQMAGLHNATIDAEGSGARAELDDQGRYKIRQSFDLREEGDGKASMYVRKAEPYGGAHGGMHFPLLKGTDVVVACVNGDPNRPVILGAVPNPRNRSVVTSQNATWNRIQTTSGSGIHIDDGPASGATGGAFGSAGTLAPLRAFEGEAVPAEEAGGLAPARTHSGATPPPTTAPPPPKEQSAVYTDTPDLADGSRIIVNATAGTTKDTASQLLDDCYLRIGKSYPTREKPYNDKTSAFEKSSGILQYIPKDHDVNVYAGGDIVGKSEEHTRMIAKNFYAVAKEDADVIGKKVGLTAKTSSPDDTATISDFDNTKDNASWSDGSIQIHAEKNVIFDVGGSIKTYVDGERYTDLAGSSVTMERGKSSVSVFMGNKVGVCLGGEETLNVGAKIVVIIGPTMDVRLGASLDLKLSIGFEYKYAAIALYETRTSWAAVKTDMSNLKADVNAGIEAKAASVRATVDAVIAQAQQVLAKTVSVDAETKTIEAKTETLSVDVAATLKATL